MDESTGTTVGRCEIINFDFMAMATHTSTTSTSFTLIGDKKIEILTGPDEYTQLLYDLPTENTLVLTNLKSGKIAKLKKVH
jgi:hypothetical protein